MGEFSSTGISYLVRSSHGVYYWQAKIAGKSRRGSLRTKSQSVAKSRLSRELEKARARFNDVEFFGGSGADLVTLGDWLREWLRREGERVGIRKATFEDYGRKVGAVLKAAIADIPANKLTGADLRGWWVGESSRLAPVTANHRLRVLKAAMALAWRERGWGMSPADGLERKPLKQVVRALPPGDVVRLLADDIRSQGKRFSIESAELVEFLAWSGVRPGEVRHIEAADIQGDWLVVRGGEDGTKNGSERMVPINAELRSLIERAGMREREGKLFQIKSPVRALSNACKRAGVEALRVYDLRHFFGTACIESGVDIATVANWMGHKDGGALLLKTYTHVRGAHSLHQAGRVRFG